GPHWFNTLVLEPPGGMLLLALVLQGSPALLLVRIVRQDIFEATYGVASFQSASQPTPQVSVEHSVHEVGHDFLDLPLQVFGNWPITALGIAELRLRLVQFLLLPGVEASGYGLAFFERIPDVGRNTHDAPGVSVKVVIVLIIALRGHRPR